MQFDWFTFGAQIVNFLILLFLLKRFLYGPIVKAMEKREKTISDRLNEARIKLEEAETESQDYQAKKRELEQKRIELLEKSKEDAEQYRKKLMHQAREDVDKIEKNWREAIIREQTSFMHDLSQRAESQIIAIARRMMRDLANRDIEKQAILVFFERIRELEADEWETVAEMVRESEKKMIIKTRFEIEEEWKQELVEIIKKQFGEDIEPRFEMSSELGFGIEIRIGGRKLAWTLDSYLGMLEERISDALEEALEQRIGEIIHKKPENNSVDSEVKEQSSS